MHMNGWLHHVDITVSDLAGATEFYDRVLPLMGFSSPLKKSASRSEL
jgi:predicted enzyme related to lactoylglutathione lyase